MEAAAAATEEAEDWEHLGSVAFRKWAAYPQMAWDAAGVRE